MAISMLMPLAVLDFATWTPLIPVVGTLLVILGGETNWMSRILIQNRLVVWTGLISYSLYLWHWPILSFATIVYDAMPPHALHAALCGASVGWNWPAAHTVQAVAPTAEYCPASHSVQYESNAESAPSPFLPAAHATHAALPASAWN